MAGITDDGECNSNGQCSCKRNVGGLKCSECQAGFFNFSSSNPGGCQGKKKKIQDPEKDSIICMLVEYIRSNVINNSIVLLTNRMIIIPVNPLSMLSYAVVMLTLSMT